MEASTAVRRKEECEAKDETNLEPDILHEGMEC
jgi:hypothetical protein